MFIWYYNYILDFASPQTGYQYHSLRDCVLGQKEIVANNC